MNALSKTVTERALWGAFAVAAALLVVGCDNPTSSNSNGDSGSVTGEIELQMQAAELRHAFENNLQSVTIDLSSKQVRGDGSLDPDSNRLLITISYGSGSQDELAVDEYDVVDLTIDDAPNDTWYLPALITRLQYIDGGSLQQFAVVGGSIKVQEDAVSFGSANAGTELEMNLTGELEMREGVLGDGDLTTVAFEFEGAAKVVDLIDFD